MNQRHPLFHKHIETHVHHNHEQKKHKPNCQTDSGGLPFVFDIHRATLENKNYRTAVWTGKYLQLTLMSINPYDDIGLELHPDTDQFLRVEQGTGIVKMGKSKNSMNFQKPVYPGTAILIPAGFWHNVINTGKVPLKVYSIYAPPHHPYCTVHKTKKEAQEAEEADAFDDLDLQFLNHK